MLKLYHGTTSVCSQKVRLGLAEIGLDFESQIIDLQKGDQFDPEYTRLNPDAVVPTLVDGDLVVVESSLILEYLDRTYNDGRMMPTKCSEEAAARHWLLRSLAIHGAINSLTFSTVNRSKILSRKSPEEIAVMLDRMPDPVARLKRQSLYDDGLDSPFVDQALLHLRRTFTDMTDILARRIWITGDKPGIADIAILSYIDRLERLGFSRLWRGSYPGVGDWLSALQMRPSYSAAIDAYISDADAAEMKADGESHWDELNARWAVL